MAGRQGAFGNPFIAALGDQFGPCTTTPHAPNATLASASGEGVISTLPVQLYGITYNVSANNTALDIRYVDATATSIGTPVTFNLKTLTAGLDCITFSRPLAFNNGLCWVNSATGTATPQLYLHWGPM